MPSTIYEYIQRLRRINWHECQAKCTTLIDVKQDYMLLIDLVAIVKREKLPIPAFLKCYER